MAFYKTASGQTRNRALVDSTELTRLGHTELSKLASAKHEKELNDLIISSLRESYRRIRQINKSEYAKNEKISSDYNKMFTNKMGENINEAIKKYRKDVRVKYRGKRKQQERLQAMHEIAAYLKRHLESELSSKEGILNLRMRQLKGFTSGLLLGEEAEISRVDKKMKKGYDINGTFYSDEDLTDFWDKFHKAMETTEGQALSGGSNYAIDQVIEAYFNNNTTDQASLDSIIVGLYKNQ